MDGYAQQASAVINRTQLVKVSPVQKSGLSESTIANIFKRNSDPTITTLMAVCNGFGITLSQFFAEQEMVELSPELRELFENWVPLALEQKAAILQVIKTMNVK